VRRRGYRTEHRHRSDAQAGRRIRVAPALFLLSALALGGCANGDFGRLKQELVIDDIHGWVGSNAANDAGVVPSMYPLTDEERRLRDLAYPLIEPPFDRARFYSIINEYGINNLFSNWPHYDRTIYAKRLMETPYRSATARYSQLNTDIRNDVVRIPDFFLTARRVLDLDRKREQAVALVPDLNPAERKNATRRAAENLLVVEWVQQSLQDRAEGYRFTLERLVVATPAPMAAEVERSINLMKSAIAQNQLSIGRPPLPGVPVAGPLAMR
jgi:hypothetical protein